MRKEKSGKMRASIAFQNEQLLRRLHGTRSNPSSVKILSPRAQRRGCHRLFIAPRGTPNVVTLHHSLTVRAFGFVGQLEVTNKNTQNISIIILRCYYFLSGKGKYYITKKKKRGNS